MSTTPTLRDAAQAVLDGWAEHNTQKTCDAMEALRAALTQGAGAVEPVAHLWRNVIDGRPRVVMPDSIITADASWVVEDSLHTATQLQQAVARALDEAADFICSGPPPAKVEGGHIEIGKRARRAYAAAIRAKGTHD